jgi:hypothetical protein
MDGLAVLEVADSRFLGFCACLSSPESGTKLQQSLRAQFPEAAHIPLVWVLGNGEEGWDEDGEPLFSVGPGILEELRAMGNVRGIAVAVVRFFGGKLLGVTCGRLPQCYRSISKLTLHRYFNGALEPLDQEIMHADNNVYGMAAGDCELIIDVVSDPDKEFLDKVRDELNFDGFQGALGEVLPRLQNLQADLSENLIPIYRYPGNYSGDEWKTYDWSPTSRIIKDAVEEGLKPLVEQKMNHCVTNYYRDGDDFIDHHSDKVLDLSRDGVIVSVSLGDERILELKRRTIPRDVTRIVLPHGSMLVLGPKTNKLFTHSILKKTGSKEPRLSLTVRDVKTFMDSRTGRLFGQGVDVKSLDETRKMHFVENNVFFAGFCALSAIIVSKQKLARNTNLCLLLAGAFATGSLSFRLFSSAARRRREERAARDFFSKTSSSGTKY